MEEKRERKMRMDRGKGEKKSEKRGKGRKVTKYLDIG